MGRGASTVVAVLLVLLTCLAAASLPALWFSDDYREIFRSDDADFRLLDTLSARFGEDEQQVVVLLETRDLVDAGAVKRLETLTRALEALPGVTSVIAPTGVSGLFRLVNGDGENERLRETLRRHPLLAGRLVSTDLRSALLLVNLDSNLRQVADQLPVLNALDRTLDAHRGPGVSLSRAGLPFVRAETVTTVQRDQVVFTTVGLLLGALIALAAFRALAPAVLVAFAPVVAMLWLFGVLAWSGEPVNVINNVVPVLVLVIGMTDTVHYTRRFQSLRAKDVTQAEAAWRALRQVAMPCALATLTTMAGFLSLALAEVDMVRRFGVTAAAGLALSLVAVLGITPLLAAWTPLGRSRRAPAQLLSPAKARQLVSRVTARPVVVSLVGTGLLLAGLAAAASLHADYRYQEFLAEDSPTREALQAMDRSFGGTLPVRVLVNWPPGAPPATVLEVIEGVDRVLGDNITGGETQSILAALRVAGGGADDPANPLAQVPERIRAASWDDASRSALVEIRVPDHGAAWLTPRIERLESELATLADRYSGFTVQVNGLAPVTARASLRMLDTLAWSLALAAAVITATLCLAFRSLRIGLVSLLPNLLPLAAICGFLWLAGRPLQFTTLTLMTIVLGLAVDDSIHFLAAWRRAADAGKDALASAVASVGNALVVTTALLVAGFGALGLSQAPLMSLFGWLSALALLVALLADLVFLPALLRAWSGRYGPPATAGASP